MLKAFLIITVSFLFIYHILQYVNLYDLQEKHALKIKSINLNVMNFEIIYQLL